MDARIMNELKENDSKDEVDFIKTTNNNNTNNNNVNNVNKHHTIVNSNVNLNATTTITNNKVPKTPNANQNAQQNVQQACNNNNNSSSSNSCSNHKTPKERLTIFGFAKKTSKSSSEEKPKKDATTKEKEMSTDSGFPCTPTSIVPIGTPPPRHHKFVKSTSISRLLGSTYSAKKYDKEEKKSNGGKFNTYGGRRRTSGPYLERFKRYAKDDADVGTPAVVLIEKTTANNNDTLDSEMLALEQFQGPHNHDLGSKAIRTITRGLGKLWWRRTHSVAISSPDPEFKVSYLGNVLTGWAKGKRYQ